MRRLGIITLSLALSAVSMLLGANPAWWTATDTKIIDPNASHAVSENYAPANLGQLKKVATQAKKYLDPLLPANVQKTAVEAKLAEFAPDNGVAFTAAELAANYAPLNLGQLKATAKPFYDWINSAGGSTLPYPWTATTTDDANYAPANLGQLKKVFSFELTNFDTDGDGLADAWELQHFGDLGHDATTDTDGDTVSDVDEIAAGTNWNDFFNGQPPQLAIVSGDNQAAPAGAVLAQPLVAQVRNGLGATYRGSTGTVIFTVATGNAQLASSASGSNLSTTRSVAVSGGQASTYLKLPATAGTQVTVQAACGVSQVVFHAYAPGNGISGPDTTDLDSNGLPDWWEVKFFGANSQDPGGDNDGSNGTGDGLTNQEEYEADTDPTKDDTDGDGVVDGQDGWAGSVSDPASNSAQAKLAPPRISITKYAVIDVGPFDLSGWRQSGYHHNDAYGRSVYLNDSGDLAFAEQDYPDFDKKIWEFKDGVLKMIYQRSSPNEEFFLGGIAPDGTVLATKFALLKEAADPWASGSGDGDIPDDYNGSLQAYTSAGSWAPQARSGTLSWGGVTVGFKNTAVGEETAMGMSSSGKFLILSHFYDSYYDFYQNSTMAVGGEMTPIDDTSYDSYHVGELDFVYRGSGSYHCINNDGTIVGEFNKWSDPNTYYPSSYNRCGYLESGTLHQLGDDNSSANSINNLGHIKGYNHVSDHYEGVIYLRKNGSYEEVKTAALPVMGDLNDRMEMVVNPGWPDEDSAYKGKVWQNFKWFNLADRIATSPGAPQWTDITVQDINNKGVIAATAKKDGTQHLIEHVPVGLIYDKAVNSPWWKTDLGTTELFDPRNPAVPDEQKAIDSALTIYYNKVRDDQGVVEDFDIQLLFGPISGATWTKFDGPTGPDTGTLQNANQGDAKYSNPKKGGLYRFDLHYMGKTARTQAWLPKAGPDISSYWQSEVDYFHNTWGPAYRSKQNDRLSSFASLPGLRTISKHQMALQDMAEVGSFLDWDNPGGKMIKTDTSPEGGPEGKTGQESRYTIKGRVIDFRKRNNMMFALIGSEMGISEIELFYGAWFNTGNPDSHAAQDAYSAGVRLYEGNSLENVMKAYGFRMQEPGSWTEREWPSDETTSQGLVRKAAAKLNALIQ